MDKSLSPEFISKTFKSGRYALVGVIFMIVLSFFGIISISEIYLSAAHVYLVFNGSTAGAIIYRGHRASTTENYCPKCHGTLEMMHEYKCPSCGVLKFK